MGDIKGELHKRGLRATPGRVALLSMLKKAGKPLSVRDILERSGGRLLDQVSLYRALESLADKGLVYRGVGPVMKYEIAAPQHHHHLVCVECGFMRGCKTC